MPMRALETPVRDPFLLPVCECGGPMNLALQEPHPTRAGQELKTFECQLCAAQHVFTVEKRVAERD